MKRGEKQYKTMEERRNDVLREYMKVRNQPMNISEFASHLGISRAYLYKMGLSSQVLQWMAVDSQ